MVLELAIEVRCNHCRRIEWTKLPSRATPEAAAQELLRVLRRSGWLIVERKDVFVCPECTGLPCLPSG